jgi:hypothetical protein
MSDAPQAPHRRDGFDPDAALEEIRELRAWLLRDVYSSAKETANHATRLAVLVDLLDHWLILGCEPPAEWRWPAPELAGARIRLQGAQPKRTTRAERRSTKRP